jgi:alpha-beta hydrolase superfamily lysophospholipase
MSIDRASLPSPSRVSWYRRPWFLVALGSLVALLLLFHVAGGWYFSTQLGNDGFVVKPPSSEFDIEVVAASEEEITLLDPEGEDGELYADGVHGFDWRDGYAQLGSVLRRDGDQVVRELRLLAGSVPVPGTLGDVDKYAYPADPSRAGIAYEDVRYETPVGPMDAWFVPGTSERWVILVHGKGVDRAETLRVLVSVAALGHPVLSITYRNDQGQPADPSGYYRFGTTEWQDLEGAVRYARDAGAADVVLVGFSTGGTIAVSFMDRSPLADEVAAVVLDAPNLDLGRAVDVEAAERSLPLVGLPIPPTLLAAAKVIAELRYDFDFGELDYLDRAAAIAVPLLVFHGTEDGTVPVEVSRHLAEERPATVYVEIAGAGHVESWNRSPAGYEERLRAFLVGLG